MNEEKNIIPSEVAIELKEIAYADMDLRKKIKAIEDADKLIKELDKQIKEKEEKLKQK